MTYRDLKDIYQNDSNNLTIGKELMSSCLAECNHYRRGTAYFSSSSLKTYAAFLVDIIKNDVKMEILCSPIIQDYKLIEILNKNSTEEKKHAEYLKAAENILLHAVGFGEDPNNVEYRSKILSYLISKGQLEIKFAIPNGYEKAVENGSDFESLYHVKNGYFDFPNGDKVAFDGSFNESLSGHYSNRERTNVFRSWHPEDEKRLERTISDIDNDWNEKSSDLDIYPLSDDILLKINKLSPKSKPYPNKNKPVNLEKNSKRSLWKHQEQAILKFIKERKGILEMATGTGKTTTALEIARRLYEDKKIDSIVVCTYGDSLLSQWSSEVGEWTDRYDRGNFERSVAQLKLYKNFGSTSQMQIYLSAMQNSILVVSRDAKRLRSLLTAKRFKRNRERVLIIHDEVHGFGSETMVKELGGLHDGIGFRLGLSATPDREYDEKGTQFLTNEIGEVIFQFSIDKAIEKGILCEFNYHPVYFKYTENDKKKIKNIRASEAAAEKNGNPWTKEKLFRKLSVVRKKAEMKPELLDKFLSENPGLVGSSIFYTQDQEQGDLIAEVVAKYTDNFSTFYQGQSDDFIRRLGSGKTDALVACERLNEGVDIRSLKNIYLLATPRAKLVTIQRMGRCLRIDPNNKEKVANVIDFILESEDEESADQYRKEWITKLSITKNKQVDYEQNY